LLAYAGNHDNCSYSPAMCPGDTCCLNCGHTFRTMTRQVLAAGMQQTPGPYTQALRGTASGLLNAGAPARHLNFGLPADRLTFQNAVILSAQEHIGKGGQGLIIGVSQDVIRRRSGYGNATHPDAVMISVICAYAIVERACARNLTPERLARTALERAGLLTLAGIPVTLETSADNDGCHIREIPEYHELTGVAAWDAAAVAALTFRLEENLRRSAAGDNGSCYLWSEFWSNLLGQGRLTYTVYMVSTIHN
jgi:hypothetical protein